MTAFQRPAGHRSLALAIAAGALLTGVSAAAPAAAQVAGHRAVPASSGARQWVSFYTGPGAHEDFADAVAVAPDGAAVFVTGPSESAPRITDFATVGYNSATGARLWARRYDGTTAAGGGMPQAVAVSPDSGTVFVTGSSPTSAAGLDYVTIAYSAATGKRLWLSRYNGPASGDDYPFDVAVSPDGSEVVVTGASIAGPPGTGLDYATVAYDAATGAQLWVSRYGPQGSSQNIAYSLAVGPHGTTVYVTGASGPDYGTVAYSAATGAQLWVSRGPAGIARSIAVGSGGGTVYVTGASGGDPTAFATVAYDAATGAKRWERRYNGAGASGSFGNSVAVSPSGRAVYVTGAAAFHYATVAYSAATGARLWVSTGPGHDNSEARQVAVGPRGHTVYVTGGSGSHFATVAYGAATGSQRWVRRYPGQGISLAVSPVTGAVFVTGFTQRPASSGDFATIAYHG